MKFRLTWKKGAVLLQTLVMSVLLCMIAVMVMKWVLARYVITGRMYRSSAANIRVKGCVMYKVTDMSKVTDWNMPSGSGSCDNGVTYNVANPASPGAPRAVTVNYDEDQ